MAWYKEWFGEEYLELYAHRDEGEADRHVDFVVRHLGTAEDGTTKSPGSVLDLACGAGRHTAALRRRGYTTVGIDLSKTLLVHEPRVPSVAGDMGSLPFAETSFDWVLNFFTSFGYFERERQNFRVLEEIARVLRPQGRFLIDFLNRDRVLATLEPRETQEIAGRRIEIERWFDTATQRINKRIHLPGTGSTPRTYLESVRAYTREEVTIGLLWAGLEVESLFGNFDGDSFDSDSDRLIIIGRRPH
jgi:SAM-dependent methyltransferase